VAQGSPRPSASVPGFQGCPEAEAVVAGLYHHELLLVLLVKCPRGVRDTPGAACGAPHSFRHGRLGTHCCWPQAHF